MTIFNLLLIFILVQKLIGLTYESTTDNLNVYNNYNSYYIFLHDVNTKSLLIFDAD